MRSRWYVALLLGVFLLTLGRSGGIAQEPPAAKGAQASTENDRLLHQFSEGEFARIVRGFLIAPVPLNLRGKDLALVGLGSYIVNAQGACNDCHTNPPFADGGDPFLGRPTKVNADRYMAGGTPFGPPGEPNTPVSRNLTPRASTGLPAGLTWQQFRQVMRTGADLKHRPPFVPSEDMDLLQVMPWPVYQDM